MHYYLTLERPLNETYKRHIYYNGALRWNELAVNIRNLRDYNIFKSKQKEWMLRTNRTFLDHTH